MKKTQASVLWMLALAVLLVAFVFVAEPAVLAAEADGSIEATEADTTTPEEPTDGETVDPSEGAEDPDVPEGGESTPKQGLVVENGKIYFYNEDGTLFTGGYKEITTDGVTHYYYFQEDGSAFTEGYKPFTKDGTRVYYYFQEDGTAYTDGYLNFTVLNKEYFFYFQEDGSAFTGGYKEITIDGKLHYFYFLTNGQGFNTGYKTVMIDGKKYYFFFGEDGRAVTDTMEAIPLGDRTAYMLFTEDGKAYTNGYKEQAGQESTDYYYFLSNGQAFTTGYKTVKIDGVTYYFFFEEDGKAYTQGLKEVPFGKLSYYYYFQDNGRAQVSTWQSVNDQNYYFQANGRAAQNSFVTIEENLYYFGDTFTVTTGGWFCLDSEKGYYYADENGVLLTNTVFEGYKLDKNGKCSTKYRINQYVDKHTDPSMTDQEKIDALYNWVLKNSMGYIRTYEHVRKDWVWKESWVDDFAASQMDNWAGNCFRYAAFLGMLIHEATDLPVTVYHGECPGVTIARTPHGWCTVYQDGDWYVYDVELDKFTNRPKHLLYKVLASESTQHLDGVGTNLF